MMAHAPLRAGARSEKGQFRAWDQRVEQVRLPSDNRPNAALARKVGSVPLQET